MITKWMNAALLSATMGLAAVSTSSQATEATFRLTPTDYDLFVFASGGSFILLKPNVAEFLGNTTLTCATGRSDVTLGTPGGNGENDVSKLVQAFLLSARTTGQDFFMTITDKSTSDSNQACFVQSVNLIAPE